MIPIRPILRDLIGNVLYASGITRPTRVARNYLNIVTFHRILPEEKLKTYPIPEIAVSIDELRWFVRFFRDHFVCAPLVECVSRWRAAPIGRHVRSWRSRSMTVRGIISSMLDRFFARSGSRRVFRPSRRDRE